MQAPPQQPSSTSTTTEAPDSTVGEDTDPALLSPKQRLEEVAALLAAAWRRTQRRALTLDSLPMGATPVVLPCPGPNPDREVSDVSAA